MCRVPSWPLPWPGCVLVFHISLCSLQITPMCWVPLWSLAMMGVSACASHLSAVMTKHTHVLGSFVVPGQDGRVCMCSHLSAVMTKHTHVQGPFLWSLGKMGCVGVCSPHVIQFNTKQSHVQGPFLWSLRRIGRVGVCFHMSFNTIQSRTMCRVPFVVPGPARPCKSRKCKFYNVLLNAMLQSA